MLMDRKYKPKVIDAAFSRIKAMPRETTLKKVQRDTSQKTTFITTYDPRLPNMGSVVHTHYKTLTMDPKMKEVFQASIGCLEFINPESFPGSKHEFITMDLFNCKYSHVSMTMAW